MPGRQMNKQTLKILISGTGIAGAAAALYLQRDGHQLTLIDTAPSFRKLGFGLSLKSFGGAVMRDLGLFDALQQRAIPVDTIQVREADGTLLKAYAAADAASAAEGAVAVYRSDLHDVLSTAVQTLMPIRFGTGITAIAHDKGGAHVTFSTGETQTFDLVIVAEGVHASTRALLWEDEGYHAFDVIYAAASVEQDHWADPGVVEISVGLGTNFGIIPVSEQQALIYAYFRGTFERDRGASHAKTLLLNAFQHFDQKITRLIERITAENEVFYDGVGLVQLPRLSKQRVALLGDAGYCPTFLSGMGASLGLIGAKALGQSLRGCSSTEIEAALARYDALMLPLTRHFQENAARHVETLLTLSPTRLWLRDMGMRLLPQALLGRAFGRQFDAERELVKEIMGAAD
jgi:2-polyprenyl-6-methoxyphenol hydroxylase-like FAD-dependent oxidoreductase